jgi:hypothetical protein
MLMAGIGGGAGDTSPPGSPSEQPYASTSRVNCGRLWAGAVATAVVAALVALVSLAAAALHLLTLTTPRPRAFFGTIVGLATVAAAVTPFALSGKQSAQIATAVTAALVSLVIGSLLSSVADRATTRVDTRRAV